MIPQKSQERVCGEKYNVQLMGKGWGNNNNNKDEAMATIKTNEIN